MSDWKKLTAFAAGHPPPLALATIVRTRGSSYRRAGARMLIAANGESVGALSGGCLEEEIIRRALAVLREGKPSLCTFDTRVRQGCHGSMEVWIEALPPDSPLLTGIAARLQARTPAVLRTGFAGLPSPSRLLTAAEEKDEALRPLFHRPPTLELSSAPGAAALCELIPPPTRLLIAGAGPDATALAAGSRLLGWDLLQLAHPAEPSSSTTAEVLCALSPDRWTAAVVVSHQYARDLEYLSAFLTHDLFYLGLVGPRKRREQLLTDLMERGIDPAPEALARLHAPAGLDLGGESPAEIALSILAEIQAVLAARDARPLSRKKSGIHAPDSLPA